MIRLEMKNYNMILIEKLPKQVLLSSKIDKYEYLTGEEMLLPSNKKQIIEQAKFTHSPQGKAFEKQTQTIEDQRKNQISAIKVENK